LKYIFRKPAGGLFTRLPVGTVWQILSSNGTIPQRWAAPSSWWDLFDRVYVAWPQTLGTIMYQVSNKTGTIAWVKASLLTLPTGADFEIDIRKNGTAVTDSIFTSDTPISITTWQSATNWIYTTTSTTIDNGSFVANDVLYIIVTQIWSTLPGSDLSLTIY